MLSFCLNLLFFLNIPIQVCQQYRYWHISKYFIDLSAKPAKVVLSGLNYLAFWQLVVMPNFQKLHFTVCDIQTIIMSLQRYVGYQK